MNRKSLADYAVSNIDKNPAKLSEEIAAYLIENNAVGELDSLSRDIVNGMEDRKSVVELDVCSAHDLSATDKSSIEKLVKSLHPKSKKIIMNHKVDPSLVGGVKLDFANASLDMTVKAKLNKLRIMVN